MAILAALPLAYALRFNLTAAFLEEYRAQFLTGFVVLVLVRLLLRHVCHLQRMMWRYTGILELRRLVMTTTVGTLIAISVAAFVTRLEGMPRSVFILEWGIYLFLAAGARISYRMLWEIWGGREGRVSHRSMKPVIVIGAGVAGSALAKELAQSSNLGEYAVAFVDDDPTKRSREVLGVPVYGPIELLPQLIARFDTHRVYIALPSATSGQMRRIVRLCEEAGAEFRTLPSLGDIVSGRATLHQLRPVRLEDLLGREPVTIDAEGISRWLRGKRVLGQVRTRTVLRGAYQILDVLLLGTHDRKMLFSALKRKSCVFYGQRNLEYLFLKNLPFSLLLRCLPAHLLFDLLAFGHFTIRGHGLTFLQAKGAALRALPAVLRKRRVIQKQRQIPIRRMSCTD